MALNWAMLTEDGARPVPLPQEKIFYSVEHCSLLLEYKNQKLKWEAKGTAFVTNKRIVFVRQPPLPAPADPSQPSQHLRTLSVPLSRFLNTRYMIPIFSAAFYEARIMAVQEGGLPNDTMGGHLKLWFSEGGGTQFSEAVEEVKRRVEDGSAAEALPLYEPPPEGSQAATSAAAATAAAASPETLHEEPASLSPLATTSSQFAPSQGASSTSKGPQPGRARRMDSLPAPEELEAASVALAQEERERAQEIARAAGDNVPHPPSHTGAAVTGQQSHGDNAAVESEEPPAYEA